MTANTQTIRSFIITNPNSSKTHRHRGKERNQQTQTLPSSLYHICSVYRRRSSSPWFELVSRGLPRLPTRQQETQRTNHTNTSNNSHERQECTKHQQHGATNHPLMNGANKGMDEDISRVVFCFNRKAGLSARLNSLFTTDTDGGVVR